MSRKEVLALEEMLFLFLGHTFGLIGGTLTAGSVLEAIDAPYRKELVAEIGTFSGGLFAALAARAAGYY